MNARIIIEKLYYSNLHLVCLFNNSSFIEGDIGIFSEDREYAVTSILNSYISNFNHHVSQI